ncbi:hypothetical protein [Streptomyces griseorubiginosus]|uniref:hypothetical protein n=1 Tax=Streptomyces griseorubiginosus TaxID=67304 RepID=UPI00076C4E58|nr:hypothetical protein [Streptomyces griseorubiginosus]KUM69254.1 hypothetical protein AQI84_34575 [Streptomyces griseorubiginosus]
MPRTYRIDPQVAHERAKAAHSPSTLIKQLGRRADEITPEERDAMLGIALRSEPNRTAPLSPEIAAELRRLLGGAVR